MLISMHEILVEQIFTEVYQKIIDDEIDFKYENEIVKELIVIKSTSEKMSSIYNVEYIIL